LNALDLMPYGFRLLVIHFHGSGTGQSSLCPIHDCHHQLQIAQEFGAGPGRSLLLLLPLCFEKQLGIIQNALADRRRAFAPGGI